MFYHINIADQIRRIVKKTKLFETRGVKQSSCYQDITDGAVYKNILESKVGTFIRRKEAFTFVMNTDGISLAVKSNLSLWPIFLAINEIPIEDRFCIDNVIVAGTELY
jgi:hypothetical protein